MGFGPHVLDRRQFLYRKEVIQPLLRQRLPCYDLVPIAGFGFALAKASSSAASNFVGLTGGVYKTRERIHRSLLICDYYRFRLHEGGLQPSI